MTRRPIEPFDQICRVERLGCWRRKRRDQPRGIRSRFDRSNRQTRQVFIGGSREGKAQRFCSLRAKLPGLTTDLAAAASLFFQARIETIARAKIAAKRLHHTSRESFWRQVHIQKLRMRVLGYTRDPTRIDGIGFGKNFPFGKKCVSRPQELRGCPHAAGGCDFSRRFNLEKKRFGPATKVAPTRDKACSA